MTAKNKDIEGMVFVRVSRAGAGAYETGWDGIAILQICRVRAGAYETGWQSAYPARVAPAKSTARVPCGAKRHRDGQPCQAKSEPGKRRCRFHGGRSTGPKTPEGKARALANLWRNRPKDA